MGFLIFVGLRDGDGKRHPVLFSPHSWDLRRHLFEKRLSWGRTEEGVFGGKERVIISVSPNDGRAPVNAV